MVGVEFEYACLDTSFDATDTKCIKLRHNEHMYPNAFPVDLVSVIGV